MSHVLDNALSAFGHTGDIGILSDLCCYYNLSSAKSLTLVLQYSVMSFTKIRKSTGQYIVPCGTPDTTYATMQTYVVAGQLFGVDLYETISTIKVVRLLCRSGVVCTGDVSG